MILFLSVLFSFSLVANAQPEKEPIGQSVRDKVSHHLTSLDIGFGFNFFNVTAKGAGASLGYKYKVSPSYESGLFSRFDRYPGNISLSPSAWLLKNSKFGVTVAANSEIQFIRQFKSQGEALMALPYSPFQSPTTSRKAVEELEEGDYASLVYKLSGYAGVGNSWSSVLNSSVSLRYSISSQYGVQIFRLKKNHIRLKVFVERSDGPGFSFGSQADESDFDLFNLDYINKRIRKWIGTNVLSGGISSREREVYLADFVLNLNNEEVGLAFDHLMKRVIAVEKEKLQLLNPIVREQKIVKYLLELTSELEDLHQRDINSNWEGSRRVVRLFLGKDIVPLAENSHVKLGNGIFSIFSSKSNYDNVLTYKSMGEETEHYTLPDSSYTSGFEALFGFIEEKKIRSMSAILKRDKDENIESFVDLGFSSETRDKTLSVEEFTDTQRKICHAIGEKFCRQVDWKQYTQNKTHNFSLRWQYVFNRHTYYELALLSRDDYRRHIEETIRREEYFGLADVISDNEDCFLGSLQCDLYELYGEDIDQMVELLYKTFHNDDLNVAYERFFELRWNSIFAAIGGQIIKDMIPEDRLEKVLTVVLEMNGVGKDPIKVVFRDPGLPPPDKDRAIYDYVRGIQTFVFNRGFNLRLQYLHGDLQHLNP